MVHLFLTNRRGSTKLQDAVKDGISMTQFVDNKKKFRKCRNCGRKGHYARECRFARRETEEGGGDVSSVRSGRSVRTDGNAPSGQGPPIGQGPHWMM